MNKYICMIILIITSICNTSVNGDDVKTPQFKSVVGWLPHYQYFLNDTPIITLQNILENNAGWYNVYKYYDIDCTPSNLEAELKSGVGIFVLYSHGNEWGIRLEARRNLDDIINVIDDYKRNYENYIDVDVNKMFSYDMYIHGNTEAFYGITIDNKITDGWAKMACLERQGILLDVACKDGENAHEYCNSRTTYSYEVIPVDYVNEHNELYMHLINENTKYAYENVYQERKQLSMYGKISELYPKVKGYKVNHPGNSQDGSVIVYFSSDIKYTPQIFTVLGSENMVWRNCQHGYNSPHWVNNDHKIMQCCYHIKEPITNTYKIIIKSDKCYADIQEDGLMLVGNEYNCISGEDYIIEMFLKYCQ